MRALTLALASLAAALIVATMGAAVAEPLKLRVGWVLVPAEITPIFPNDPSVVRHAGKSYVIEPMRFQGSSLYTSALAAGELDIAPFGYSSFALAVQNANLDDLRIIADEDRDGYGGYFTTQYMVRKDSAIHQVEDLKGKILASPSVGSISDMALRFMLRRHNLDAAKDVSFVEIALPNMNAVLLESKADLIASVLPFYLDPALQSGARTLFTGVDAMGPAEISMMTAREGFLREHRAAVVDFLEDYLRVLHWYNDPANRAAALHLVASFTKLPAERFASWAFTKVDYYRDPKGLVDTDSLQKNLDVQRQLGYLKGPLDAKHYVDMSLIEEAAKRQ
jgi:NitT/TauT family transport system substrate-binding protein